MTWMTGAYVTIRRAPEHRDALITMLARERELYPHRLESRDSGRAAGNPRVRIEWRVTGLRSELPRSAQRAR